LTAQQHSVWVHLAVQHSFGVLQNGTVLLNLIDNKMEIANIVESYAFVVQWIDVSRGVFLTEYFPTYETCMDYLNVWDYNPTEVKLECIQIYPD
jgi:hypothetical protein